MAEAGIAAYKIYMVVDTGRSYPHPCGHRHARPRADPADDRDDRADRAAVHGPSPRPGDHGLHRAVLLGEGRPQPAGLREDAGRLRRASSGTPRSRCCCAWPRPRVPSCTSSTCRPPRHARDGAPGQGARRPGDAARSTTGRCSSSRWEDIDRLGPYALSYWVPDEHRAGCLGGPERRHDRHASPPTTPRTPGRRRRSAGRTAGRPTPGTPGIQYQLPPAARRGQPGPDDTRAGGGVGLPKPADDLRPGRQGPARRRGAMRTSSSPTSRRAGTITDEGVLSRCGWTPVRRARQCTAARSCARWCAASMSATTARWPASPASGSTPHRRKQGADMTMKFGLLLPHFGEHADREKLLEGSKRAEELGFDSVWVRDHLVFEPHGEMEIRQPQLLRRPDDAHGDRRGDRAHRARHRFADPVPAPAPDGARRRHDDAALRAPGHRRHGCRHVRPRVRRGRPEIDGEGTRGAGQVQRADPAPGVRRGRRLLRGRPLLVLRTSRIEPKPSGPVPFWYCGATPQSARLAVEYCDGWMPGRTTLATIAARVDDMRAKLDRADGQADADGRRHPADLDRRDARAARWRA